MVNRVIRAHPVLSVLIPAAILVAAFTVGWDRVCPPSDVLDLVIR